VSELFRTITDPNAAVAAAMAYVRGTPWYAATFPGINQGIQAGLFTDERGYRQYRNALDSVYRQWTGNPLTAEALTAALGEGVDPDIVNRRFSGKAFVEANREDLRYYSGAFGNEGGMLSEDEMQRYGQHEAGLGTPGGLGAVIQRQVAQAMQRAQRAFEGVAASPQLALTDRGALFSPSLRKGGRPDIAA
jgi:hypothetical protein